MSSHGSDRRIRRRRQAPGRRQTGVGPAPRTGRRSTATTSEDKAETGHLSGRERQIIELLIAGRSVKEASAVLGLSPRTVEGYLERLKDRFRQPRLLSLVVHLVKRGLVE